MHKPCPFVQCRCLFCSGNLYLAASGDDWARLCNWPTANKRVMDGAHAPPGPTTTNISSTRPISSCVPARPDGHRTCFEPAPSSSSTLVQIMTGSGSLTLWIYQWNRLIGGSGSSSSRAAATAPPATPEQRLTKFKRVWQALLVRATPRLDARSPPHAASADFGGDRLLPLFEGGGCVARFPD